MRHLFGHVAATTSLISTLFIGSGCTLMSVTRSPLRDPVPQSVQLADQVLLTSTGAVNVYVMFLVDHQDLFPSSVKVESSDKVIFVDPVLVDDAVKADYIFITHPHDDHLSLPDIDRLSGPHTLIICPAVVATQLGDRRHRVVEPGEAADLDGVRFEAIPSYNTRTMFLGIAPHPRADKHLSYVLEVDGARIFHPGDTDRVPELSDLADIHAALMPIGSGDLTMSTRDAAELVNELKPRIAIPVHYALGTGEADTFRELVDPGIEVVVLQQKR